MDYINKLYKEVLNEAEDLKIPISNEIKEQIIINNRAEKRFGCCKKIKKGLKVNFEIEISNRLIGCEEIIIKQTLAHEILHTCPSCYNHGALWKNYAEKMNKAYGYNIKRTETANQLGIIEQNDKQLKENYILICKKCGAKISRTRMSNVVKYPSKYRCICGGKLERIK